MQKHSYKKIFMLLAFLALICATPVQAAGFRLSKSSITISKGKSYTLQAKGASKKVSFSSDKPSVAVVNAKGKVTAKKIGKAVITAKSGTEKLTCKVTVKNSIIKKAKKPSIPSTGTVCAAIPSLGVSYKVRENKVQYGASAMKFVYSYYAYCVKNWGNKKLTYARDNATVTESLKKCAERAVRDSDNAASHAIFEYIRLDNKRRADFMKWLEKALGKKVPVMSDGGKYRIGYNDSRAYCPFTTAKEMTAFWKYVWKDGYINHNKMKLKRYQDFFGFSQTWRFYTRGDIGEEYGKIGWLIYNGDPSFSAMTNGAFYRIRLGDGKTYTMFVSYMEDHINQKTDIFPTIDKTISYVKYLGERKLEKQGKLAK